MKHYNLLAKIALVLSIIVIMLGAYTRLTDAGLGCPDWPGCYGRMVLPNTQPALQHAQQNYPNQPIVAHKAWTEMVHRYVAGSLGIIILILAIWAIVNYRRGLPQPLVSPLLLVLVLIFQAVLGMWTVTLKLLPLVVTGHLLGGMAIAGLLSWLNAATASVKTSYPAKTYLTSLVTVGLLVLILQLFLGAWTSTNYAALACGSDFPDCHGSLAPNMEWASGFNILSPVGPNYEGGRLEMPARVAIQMAHRYWAGITFIVIVLLSLIVLTVKPRLPFRWLGGLLLGLLTVQIILGILNVIELLPLGIAVAHNGVAVLLLITLVTLLQRCWKNRGI